MVLEVDVNPESVKKLEKFYGTGKYKDLAVNTQSFSRKLDEERKMRIPYVDGQVIFNVLILTEWSTSMSRTVPRRCYASSLMP